MRRKPWVRPVIFVGLWTFILFVSITIYFIYKERATLTRLLHPESVPAATLVYGRWLDVIPQSSLSEVRVTAWLESIGYVRVPGTPNAPGQYSQNSNELHIFAKPFRYPDREYPAQHLKLDFADQKLKTLIAVSGNVTLDRWRLEPPLLAEWDTFAKTAKQRVRITELPPHVPRAVLAIEDKRFFDHGAFDVVGIARAFWIDVKHASLKQGASTITQQLARSIFLDVQRTWRRKFFEAILAMYLEFRYTKPQLLEMYLNQVYWGQDGSQTLIGLESASQSFFGKPARHMTAGESATLAGMLQSPRRYSPRYSVRLSDERKRIVLGLMRDQGFISEGEYRQALVQPLKLAPPRSSNPSAYFLAMLRADLAERYEMPALISQGWRIFTTLDPLLQKEASRAMPRSHKKAQEGPQAGLVAIDPRTGAIRVWAGGTNFQTNPFDHIAEAKRQPGSAFKPFVVLAALESREATAATMIDDAPLTLPGQGGTWSPQNYDRKFRGKVSVRDSLVFSYNIPIVRLAQTVGLSRVLEVARRAGILSPLRKDLSSSLGASEVSLLELTSAYVPFANGGQRMTPYSIESIVTQDGRAIESHELNAEEAFGPNLAFLMTHILSGVLTEGTGRAAKALGFEGPAAGKTGTSENYHDAWFIGYTTELVGGVWVGHDQPKSLGRSAAGIALPIWVEFMKRASLFHPPQAFAESSDIVWKMIDPASGGLAESGCAVKRKDPFIVGTEPKDDCPLHSGGIKGLFQRWRNSKNEKVSPGN